MGDVVSRAFAFHTGVRNKIIVLFNWVWNYISYSQVSCA